MGGIQLFSIGILGLYVGQIFDQVKIGLFILLKRFMEKINNF